MPDEAKEKKGRKSINPSEVSDIHIEVYFNIELFFDIYLSENHCDCNKVLIIMITFIDTLFDKIDEWVEFNKLKY